MNFKIIYYEGVKEFAIVIVVNQLRWNHEELRISLLMANNIM